MTYYAIKRSAAHSSNYEIRAFDNKKSRDAFLTNGFKKIAAKEAAKCRARKPFIYN